MDQLTDLIRARQAELSAVETEIRAKEQRAIELRRELADAKILLFGTPAPAASPLGSAGATSTAMAEDVLTRCGHPLHVNEIMSLIEKHHGVSVKYSTLVGNMSRLLKRGKVFTRPGKNIFGLRAWDDDRRADELFAESLREEQPMTGSEIDR